MRSRGRTRKLTCSKGAGRHEVGDGMREERSEEDEENARVLGPPRKESRRKDRRGGQEHRKAGEERDEQDDKEREASLKEALADKTKVVKLVVDKWFVDKGFGNGKVPTGEIVFIHACMVEKCS